VVAGQKRQQRFVDEMTERQLREPFFPSKERRVNGSFHKGIRERWRVLTRYHYLDVRQFIAQDSEGFWHPRQFVVRKETHDEPRLCWMSDPARGICCRVHLRPD